MAKLSFGKKAKPEEPKRSSESHRTRVGDKLDFTTREAYNVLRTSLEFSCMPNPERGSRVVGITSACPQEGKSFTSANLAYALAKDGKKVLLMDGDLRRPTLHKIFGINSKPGLSNYLVGEETNVIVRGVLQENLDVIPCGNLPPNPSELIGSLRMGQILDQAALKYDYIILDLPPVNSVSDAYTASKYLDGIVMVVKHNQTLRSEFADAMRQLEFSSTKVLGVVYNGYTFALDSLSNKYQKYKYYRRDKYYSKGKYYYSKGKYYARDKYESRDYHSDQEQTGTKQ